MDQASRILSLFCRLQRRERLHIENLAMEYHMNERSIARDFHTIRMVLSELHEDDELVFDRSDKSYYLSHGGRGNFSGMDIMVLLKVLIGSRALRRDEMMELVDTMRSFLSQHDRKELYCAIEDELKNYIEPLHHKSIVKMQWDLNHCIVEHEKIRLSYTKTDGSHVERNVIPINIVFAEFYFYLVAFLDGEKYEYPAFFRLDRIESFQVMGKGYGNGVYENFRYSDMGAAVQFMYAGELLDITFRCKPFALEAILDRMPKHEIISKDKEYVLVKATVFGEGFLRWTAMQGEAVEILSPKELRKKIVDRFRVVMQMYSDVDEE